MAAWLILAVPAVIAAAVYLVSLRRHPWKPCRACSGSGKTRDRIWKQAHGTCASCGGRGRHPRLGIRLLQPGRYQQMTAGQANHKRIDKRGN